MVRLQTVAAMAALSLGAAAASAATVNIDNYTYTPAKSLTVNGTGALPDYNGEAGQFKGLLDGASFTTYCADLFQTFSFDNNYTYTVVDGVTAWGAEKSADLNRLFSAGASYVGDAVSAAVFQAAVWEILYETAGSYGFASGNMKFSSSSGSVQSALNAADPLWAMLDAQPITVKVDQLYSSKHQDFLTTTPVPEPSTYGMLAAGLLAVGAVVRRRSQRA